MWTCLGDLARGHGRWCSHACHTRARFTQDIRERYRKYAVVPDDPDACYGWTGSRFAEHGGVRYRASLGARIDGRYRRLTAGTLGWYIHHGYLPTLWVLHTCDNGLCTNPRHLFLGTHAHNMLDMVLKKRSPRGGAKLTEAAVLAMRAEWDDPYSTVGATELGRRYGVTRINAWLVCTRRSWKHLP